MWHLRINHLAFKKLKLLFPYRHTTQKGWIVFMTIVDDFTRATWLYLLKHKSDNVYLLKQFTHMVKTMLNLTINCIKTDKAHIRVMHPYFT